MTRFNGTRRLLGIGAAFALAACAHGPPAAPASAAGAPAVTAGQWRALFDGTTTAAFQGYASPARPDDLNVHKLVYILGDVTIVSIGLPVEKTVE